MTHSILKVSADKAIIKDTGSVQIGDDLGQGRRIAEIIRRSHQMGMDLVTVRCELVPMGATELAALNHPDNDSAEDHLRRADRLHTTDFASR